MERRLLLDVVVGQSTAILQLLTGENQTLLVRRDAFLVLDLGLHVLNRVARVHIKGDGLTSQRLHEDLHRTTTQAENQMERRLLLDVVVGQSTAILQLLTGENQT